MIKTQSLRPRGGEGGQAGISNTAICRAQLPVAVVDDDGRQGHRHGGREGGYHDDGREGGEGAQPTDAMTHSAGR